MQWLLLPCRGQECGMEFVTFLLMFSWRVLQTQLCPGLTPLAVLCLGHQGGRSVAT